MTISENIDYDFGNEERHGIFRDIPQSAKVDNLYRIQTYTIQNILRNGQSEKYQTSYKGDMLDIKIGNANTTITGEHTYTITYTVENGIATLDNQDELYWNVTGNKWPVPINSATATLTIPSTLQITNTTCYTGYAGSTEKNCLISENQKTFTATNLNAKQGFTIVAAFPPGTFPTNTLSNHTATELSQTQMYIIGIILLSIFAVLNVFLPIIVWQ